VTNHAIFFGVAYSGQNTQR